MKGLIVLIAVLIASILPATPAAAARGDAADFARDCNADGLVIISGVQKYIGGSATLTRICNVGMAPGSRLVFRDVELGGAGLAAISAREHTTLKVFNSVIKMDGPLELTAGCCAGDLAVPENDGTVIVKNSTLAGTSLQLMASFESPNGKVIVRNSVLDASGPLGVQIRTSTDGIVKVLDSFVASGGDVEILSWTNGLTVARRDTFTVRGTVTITTGPGGICRSSGHTPRTPCT